MGSTVKIFLMTIDENVLKFIKNHRVGVLALPLEDGSPHAATLHYSLHTDPLRFFFITSRKSRKVQGLIDKGEVKASFVIGVSWQEWVTVQMDGLLRIVTNEEVLELAKAVHYANNPDSRARDAEPFTYMLSFEPTWWRYSNFQEKPPQIISSEPPAPEEEVYGDLYY